MSRRSVAMCLALLATATSGCHRSKGPLRVAAAADLTVAFKEVGDAFEKKTGHKVVFSFGATGMLAKQIAEGAPYDLFAAANVSGLKLPIEAGACDPATQELYARGHLVVWTKEDVPAPKSLEELTDARFEHIAIANPEHAPYGMAAVEALKSARIYDQVKSKLVFGSNVQQTLELAQTGRTSTAIVALSLATVNKGITLVIDESLHQPLDQALIVCKHGQARATATEFAAFLKEKTTHQIMKKYGFLLPGEPVPLLRAHVERVGDPH
jgi:molybdate transport system substrate-binding protein